MSYAPRATYSSWQCSTTEIGKNRLDVNVSSTIIAVIVERTFPGGLPYSGLARQASSGRERERSPVPAGSQSRPAAVTLMVGRGISTASDLRLLGNLKGVIYFDAKKPDSRLQLGVPQEQLHCAQVLGAPIYQRRLGPAHRVRPVVCD